MIKIFKIGLTGGIGAGKSSVLELLKSRGVPVLQTDVIGHRLLEREKFKNRIADKFGDHLLKKNGQLDRRALALKTFKSQKNKKWLNGLLHPPIRAFVSQWAKKQEKKSVSMVVVEVPLLFEYGYYHKFDGTLSVSAPRTLRRARLVKRGWDLGEIRRREGNQWSQAEKNRKADWVIINDGSLKDLKRKVDHWLAKVEDKKKPLE